MMQIFFFFPIFILNVRAIDLGPIYDFTTTTPLGIYDYPTVRNCKHKMNEEEYQVKTYLAEVFRYSLKVSKSKFPIYLCSHFEITLTCDHRNIFHGILGGIGGTIKWVLIFFIIISLIYLNKESIMKFLRRKTKKGPSTLFPPNIPEITQKN